MGKKVMANPRWTHDRKLARGISGIVGVDEAGRGCLAGPVVAGCVILPTEFFMLANNRKGVEKINDSKQFDEATREKLFHSIQKAMEGSKLFGATASASVEEIEEHNIVGATCLAMQRAMQRASDLSQGMWKPARSYHPDLFASEVEEKTKWRVLVDGKPLKRLIFSHHGLVKGDTLSLAVAMASLLAKVSRDRKMRELDNSFPDYGFSSNKGYGTSAHLEALQKYGPTNQHRPRFVRNLLIPKDKEKVGTIVQTRLSLV